MQVSFPMYPSPAAAQERFWLGLKKWFDYFGVKHAPDFLSHPLDLHRHWAIPDVLLSQTCGYPLVTELNNKVQLIGAFAYAAEGCHGVSYRSFLVARRQDQAAHLSEFRDRKVAYNSLQSQSGYNCLRAQIAPLAINGHFFAHAIESGSHHHSIEMVVNHDADLAAIDCVSFAFFERNHPDLMAQIKVIGKTRLTPGLPLITNIHSSNHTIIAIQKALNATMTDDSLIETRQALMITDFQALPIDAYDICLDMQRQAISLGVDSL